jgi:stage III sporulation protein SpoIIIAA
VRACRPQVVQNHTPQIVVVDEIGTPQVRACRVPERGCAACVRQAMANENNDIAEVRQAANQVVHCECFEDPCNTFNTFKSVCKKHGISLKDCCEM